MQPRIILWPIRPNGRISLAMLLSLPLSLIGLAGYAAPPAAPGQPARAEDSIVAAVLALQDPQTGAFRVSSESPPSLRACNGAVKILRTRRAEIPQRRELIQFVRGCYDGLAGHFQEPGQKPTVAINAIGLMLIRELDLPREEFAGALRYLAKEATTWEDIRIAAAAVEAWGVREAEYPREAWEKLAQAEAATAKPQDARFQGGYLALQLRLEWLRPRDVPTARITQILESQLPDGGWGPPGQTTSDLETTYRVLRGLHYAGAQGPATQKAYARTQELLRRLQTREGLYPNRAGTPANLSGTYYAVMIQSWIR